MKKKLQNSETRRTLRNFLALCLVLFAFMALPMKGWGQTDVASFSRSETTNNTTGGTFSTTFSAKSGYYQDNSGTCHMQILNDSEYWTTLPESITFTATIGGGSGNRDLANAVQVVLLNVNGEEITSTLTTVTSHITTNTGDNYTISIPAANNVGGVKISHTKESGYNVRYYSFSLSYVAGTGAPTHTLTFGAFPDNTGTVMVISGNNNLSSPATLAEGATVNVTATPATGYAFSRWILTSNTPAITSTVGDPTTASTTFTMGAEDVTLQASFTQVQTYTVTYHPNVVGTTDIVETYNEGATVTVAANTFSNPGYSFTYWSPAEDGNGPVMYYAGDEIENISADIDLYAQWEESHETVDVLTSSFTGSPTSYSDWSGKIGASGAVYAGNSTGGSNNYIQIRATSPSGIVSTTSGGKVKKVVVTWHSTTVDGRTLNVYGKNTAYSTAADLYSNTPGTLLGTIVKGTSTELVISGDYTFVGLRSAESAMYFDEIDITWEAEITDAPIITAYPVELGYETPEGCVSYIVENEPDPVGTLTTSTTSDWLTLHTESNVECFTCTVNELATERTATVTLTYTYGDGQTVTKDVIVTQLGNPNAPGTQDNPYTVAQAHAAIDAGEGTTNVYAKGVVSEIVSEYSTIYSNITFNFVDNSGDDVFLQAYRCRGAEAANVAVGDTVVVSGNLTFYASGSVYEFASGCNLVSLIHPVMPLAPLTTMDEIYAKAQEVGTTETEVEITFDGWVVTGTNYNFAFVTDGTKGFYIRDTYLEDQTYEPHGFEAGNTLTGTATCLLSFNGNYSATITGITASTPELTIGNGTAEVVTIPLDELSGINTGALVTYTNLTYNAATGKLSNGTDSIRPTGILYGTGTPAGFYDFVDGESYNITGVIWGYNDVREIMPRSEADIEVTPKYALNVGNINCWCATVSAYGGENSELLLDSYNQLYSAQVPVGTNIEVSVDLAEGYVLNSLVVDDIDVTNQVDPTTGMYIFSMPEHTVSIHVMAGEYVAPASEDYELFSGDLVEGDYIIYYDGYAMKNTVSNNRLSYEIVSPDNNGVITTNDASIVWHIAPNVDFWTIYSEDIEKYAAGTGTKNQATVISSINETALWTVTVNDNTYDFENYGRSHAASNPNNKWLRYNSGYGFACYADGTGGALSLYKKVDNTPAVEPSITVAGATVNFDAGEHDGTLDITYENMPITDMTDFDIQYYDETGAEMTEAPEWIDVLVAEQELTIGEGYVVSYYMFENEGTEARAAYFKVYAIDDQNNLVYSNLVTIVQDATSPITITPSMVSLSKDGDGEEFAIDYGDIEVNWLPEIRFYEADGITPATYNHSWLGKSFISYQELSCGANANPGIARTAYFRLVVEDNTGDLVYSPLVTVYQEGADCPTPTLTMDESSLTPNGATFTMEGYPENEEYWVFLGEVQEDDVVSILEADFEFVGSIYEQYNLDANGWGKTDPEYPGLYEVHSGNTSVMCWGYPYDGGNISTLTYHYWNPNYYNGSVVISFWAKATFAGNEKGGFWIDDVQQCEISGVSQNWTKYTFEVPADYEYDFEWRVIKDGEDNNSTLYVDDISIKWVGADEMSWVVDVDNVSDINTFTLNNLEPEHTYQIYVESYCGVDNYGLPSNTVTFTTASECQTPDHLAVSNVTATSADISWYSYGAQYVTLHYAKIGYTDEGEIDFANYSEIYPIYENNYTLSEYDLEPSSTYCVWVTRSCTGIGLHWLTISSDTLWFNTPCGYASIPYIEDFDNYASSDYDGDTWRSMPDCWNAYNGTDYDWYKRFPTIVGNNNVNNNGYSYSADNHLCMRSQYTTNAELVYTDQYAIMPAMRDVNTLHVKFMACHGNDVVSVPLTIGVMTDPEDITTFEAVETIDIDNPWSSSSYYNYGYNEYTVNLDTYTGEGEYIAFMMPPATNEQRTMSVFIDDIIVEDNSAPVFCGINLSANNNYTQTIDFEDIIPAGTITDLWTGYTPDCWTWNGLTNVTDEIAPQLYRAFATSGNYSLRMQHRGIYAMPELVIEDGSINDVHMSFWMRNTCREYTIEVGIANSLEVLASSNSFVSVAEHGNTSTDIAKFEFDFSNYVDPTNGSGPYYIVLKNNSAWENAGDVYSIIYLDDITLSLNAPEACAALTVPYTENFEGYTVPNDRVALEPDCWTVAKEDAANYKDRPRLYKGFAHSGEYSLRMKDRCLYAMPRLAGGVDIRYMRMGMYLRQPNAVYTLQVGVMTDLGDESSFTPVVTLNNAGTGVEYVEFDFSDYRGAQPEEGCYIVFRNTLKQGYNMDYSYNYIDDIELSYMDCGITGLPWREGFESYPEATDKATGIAPDCWRLLSCVKENATTRPQLYRAFATDGRYSLRMSNRSAYAMPKLAAGIDLSNAVLEFDLRQPNAAYRLEVGVMGNLGDMNSYRKVTTINNEGTGITHVAVDFSSYNGDLSGRYIVFKNTLPNGYTMDYSYNYIDALYLHETGTSASGAANGEHMAAESEGYNNAPRGVEENATLSNLNIYPNPTTGTLNLSANAQRVEVYSQIGSLMAVYENVNQINISNLSEGIYFLRVTMTEGVAIRKVVKR